MLSPAQAGLFFRASRCTKIILPLLRCRCFSAFICLCRLAAAGALVLRFEMQRADVAERGHNGSGRFGEPNGHFR